MGIPSDQITKFKSELRKKGKVFIPRVELSINGENKIFSLLSTKQKPKTNLLYVLSCIEVFEACNSNSTK